MPVKPAAAPTFVPATAEDLLRLRNGVAIVVTQRFCREQLPGQSDPDALELADFDALQEAAAASAQLIVNTGDIARRVVLSIDSDDQEIVLADISAIYLDEQCARVDVAAVIDAIRDGTEPSEQQYEAMEGRFLLWHEGGELASVINDLGQREDL